MRLRQLVLALVALTGIWVGVLIQRSHQAPARAFTAGPASPDFPAPKLLHVAGLSRPAASRPIVKVVVPRAHVSPPAPVPRVPKVRTRPARVVPPESAPSETEQISADTRSAAETPPPPLEPLAITDAQVVALTSSSARATWRTNVPTQAQTAFGLDAPAIWAQPSGDSLVDHVSEIGRASCRERV